MTISLLFEFCVLFTEIAPYTRSLYTLLHVFPAIDNLFLLQQPVVGHLPHNVPVGLCHRQHPQILAVGEFRLDFIPYPPSVWLLPDTPTGPKNLETR